MVIIQQDEDELDELSFEASPDCCDLCQGPILLSEATSSTRCGGLYHASCVVDWGQHYCLACVGRNRTCEQLWAEVRYSDDLRHLVDLMLEQLPDPEAAGTKEAKCCRICRKAFSSAMALNTPCGSWFHESCLFVTSCCPECSGDWRKCLVEEDSVDR